MRSFIFVCGFFARQHLWFVESNAVWQYIRVKYCSLVKVSAYRICKRENLTQVHFVVFWTKIHRTFMLPSYASLTLHFVCCYLLKVNFTVFRAPLTYCWKIKLSSSLIRKLPTNAHIKYVMTFKLHSISYGLKAVGKTKRNKNIMKTLKT